VKQSYHVPFYTKTQTTDKEKQTLPHEKQNPTEANKSTKKKFKAKSTFSKNAKPKRNTLLTSLR